MFYIIKQNQVIIVDCNWFIFKQYDVCWLLIEKVCLKDIVFCYKVKWLGNMCYVFWNVLFECVDIILNSMVVIMVVVESGWGIFRLVCENNNLFGMKCGVGCCCGVMKGYLQFELVEQLVQVYVINLNIYLVYFFFCKLCLQLCKVDQEVIVSIMIYKLKGYLIKGLSYNNYFFVMYQDNQWFIVVYL